MLVWASRDTQEAVSRVEELGTVRRLVINPQCKEGIPDAIG
jgi:hypothetical protein